MELTADQVLALAPDTAAAAAGRKLGRPGPWQGLGRNQAALWGECRGSALYQVRVDLNDLTVRCSCPSRKFPCKHGLGLLLLAADSPAALPEGEPPAWVAEWLARRAAGAEKRAATKVEAAPGATEAGAPAAAAAAGRADGAKRAERRLARVRAGLDALDLWLHDLLREGLASVEAKPAAFWEGQVARLIDAQAPGLAARVRRLAAIPNASPDWPARLLDDLGRLALLTHAFRRIEELPPALREDLRGALGWTLAQEEVTARGETVGDDWLVLGQRVTVEERLHAQRTWLRGARSGRWALILQFAVHQPRFEIALAPGTRLDADLTFWPSAWPLRALPRERRGAPVPLADPPPGAPSLAAFLDGVADALARQPWLERFPAALHAVAPLRDDAGGWLLRDAAGAALPLARGDHWRLLALSGGRAVDLVAEWDGAALDPLGVWADGAFHALGQED